MQTSSFITRQCKELLENKQKALIYAVIFSILPFASWLSVTLVSLITLRKGAKAGFDVLLPALVIHSVPLMMLIPVSSALINAILAYLPCYLAAVTLRKTENWQMVFGVFLVQAILGCLFIQLAAPDFVTLEFKQFQDMLTQYQELVDAGMNGISSVILAQLFFGIQILSAIVSAVVSLSFARSIQAKLFLPGGFKNELLSFRSGRLGFLMLIGVSLGSYYEIPLAINLLPIMLCYFLAAGFCLAYFILSRKSQFKIFLLLILLIMIKPTFAVLAYIIFGSLDSLFNFRTYLPKPARESI